MKLRQLESYLQDVEAFENPKVLLEQYPTRAHIAACVIHTIQSSYEGIEDCLVADLGVGCGVLSVGACMLGAGHVTGFDLDADALDIARQNFAQFEIDNYDLVQTDVVNSLLPPTHAQFDTVLMNPPFGTKHNKGIDLAFVRKGLDILAEGGSLYSLHKTSTRDHIVRKARESWRVECEVVAELRYDLPASYKHHKKASVDIEVDFMRFTKKV